ncbi:uncharacterized protein BYT42DRAFT_575415 [Radiomyces spectabilis]|uniref:uncharacterized protein n=1 Tax=Radiomyces spectabilis TaxID=64574 RepID=UPI00221EA3B5|nr:uncharacterized protein BYT42DRAFT_575415 [Radiomyces spectabilis]KAI8374200.1 hypothetical protein BYT42DRAFT_575415 [Radiomyces spectabilis]
MARSLRSQTKKRYRSIKREQVFKPVEDARLKRLAKAQAEAANKPKVGDHMEEDKPVTEEKNADAMVDDEQPKKISTGGARSQKQARKLKARKGKSKGFTKWRK